MRTWWFKHNDIYLFERTLINKVNLDRGGWTCRYFASLSVNILLQTLYPTWSPYVKTSIMWSTILSPKNILIDWIVPASSCVNLEAAENTMSMACMPSLDISTHLAISLGLVWMHVYSLQSTCVEVEWNDHFNTCGLRWIHAHPNKALRASSVVTFILHSPTQSCSNETTNQFLFCYGCSPAYRSTRNVRLLMMISNRS